MWGGSPERPVFRQNHVYFVNAETDEGNAQNHAFAVVFSNWVENGIIEDSVIHHALDGLIGSNENYGGHIYRNNIGYLAEMPVDTAGNGAGFKTKAESARSREKVYGNVSFLNREIGFEMNAFTFGPAIYHNTAYGNLKSGGSVSGVNGNPNHDSLVMNNAALNNLRDLKYNGGNQINNYNFVGDGLVDGGNANSILGGNPKFSNIALLDQDADGDKTPDILEPLNDYTSFLTPGGNVDTVAALSYARGKVKETLGLQEDSPLIDAGILIEGYHCSTPGAHPGEDCREWDGDAPDIGAYEFSPTGPSVCGNGIIDPGEQCDGVNIGGKTCVDLGFPNRGTLTCYQKGEPNECKFNVSSCSRLPLRSKFDGNTTDFGNVPDVNNVRDAVLEISAHGKIQFKGQNVNFHTLNLDRDVTIEARKIGVNTGNIPRFN
ncbi:MAG: hypothetical protein HY392_00710, partial [Candidatus Diapherotrites archaeon]|nr:hypothetical protein [Candidatus Diapherotrites archaeon]